MVPSHLQNGSSHRSSKNFLVIAHRLWLALPFDHRFIYACDISCYKESKEATKKKKGKNKQHQWRLLEKQSQNAKQTPPDHKESSNNEE